MLRRALVREKKKFPDRYEQVEARISKQVEAVTAFLASVGKPEERKRAREIAAEIWKTREYAPHRVRNKQRGVSRDENG